MKRLGTYSVLIGVLGIFNVTLCPRSQILSNLTFVGYVFLQDFEGPKTART